MKQIISLEGGPRSMETGKRNVHILPRLPIFLEDGEADMVVKSGLKCQVIDIPGDVKTMKERPKLVEESTSDVEAATDVEEAVEVGGGMHGCPFCDRDGFDTPQGLASHVRAKHRDEYENWKETRD